MGLLFSGIRACGIGLPNNPLFPPNRSKLKKIPLPTIYFININDIALPLY